MPIIPIAVINHVEQPEATAINELVVMRLIPLQHVFFQTCLASHMLQRVSPRQAELL